MVGGWRSVAVLQRTCPNDALGCTGARVGESADPGNCHNSLQSPWGRNGRRTPAAVPIPGRQDCSGCQTRINGRGGLRSRLPDACRAASQQPTAPRGAGGTPYGGIRLRPALGSPPQNATPKRTPLRPSPIPLRPLPHSSATHPADSPGAWPYCVAVVDELTGGGGANRGRVGVWFRVDPLWVPVERSEWIGNGPVGKRIYRLLS